MKNTMMSTLIMFGMTFSLSAWAQSESVEIVAAAVENTASAQVIRLAVLPSPESMDEKVVCAEGMIRVRLSGVSNRGRLFQEVSTPSKGPIRRVRIVERNPKQTVVQLFPRSNPLGTCARTTAAAVGGEIVISTAYTPAEAAAVNAKPQEEESPRQVQATVLSPVNEKIGDNSASKDDTAKKDREIDSDKKKNVAKKANIDSAPTKSIKDLLKKEKDLAGADDSSGTGVGALDAPKMLLVFGFAAAVAGAAIFLKRKKKLSIADMDDIEILSTRKLGVRQQLVLVCVRDVKFLLAVSDKSVSSLGVVSGEESAVSGSRLPRMQPAPAPVSPPVPEPQEMNAESALASLISEASKRIAKDEPTPVKDAYRPRSFDSELKRALDNTVLSDEKPATQSRFDSASNAAGLVALARMRANLKKSTGRSQVFEA